MSGNSDEPSNERVARLEQELRLVRQALTLVGLKACSQCGKFFLSSDSGALFDGGEPVCMECLWHWWPHCCQRLSVPERDMVERRLVSWLVNHHKYNVIKSQEQPADVPRFHMIASCIHCEGAGEFAGRRCHACDGRGTVWLMPPN